VSEDCSCGGSTSALYSCAVHGTSNRAKDGVDWEKDDCVCDFTGPYATCPEHGEIEEYEEAQYELASLAHTEDSELCPNCCSPWKCNGPHLVAGELVTAFGKPGTVRWVTPWGAVAVVFEDEQMHWFRAEAVGAIEQRG